MKKLLLIVLFVSCGFLSRVNAQEVKEPGSSAPCASVEAHQFDFWIGEWNISQKILQADGTWLDLPATNRVSATLNGCALIEHWEGKVLFFWEGMKSAGQLKGLSIRAFNPKSKKWSIYWMDTHNPEFGTFEGEFKNGRGEFFRKGVTSSGGPLFSRITFFDITNTSVEWELALSTDGEKSWNKIWTMHMQRK